MPAPTTPQFFTGFMPFLPPNQQRQSTEGNNEMKANNNNNKTRGQLSFSAVERVDSTLQCTSAS